VLAEGSLAPDFQIGGWTLSGALKSGPVLLAFFKISCPVCQLTFPFLKRLAENAAPGAPKLVALSQDDAKSTAQFQRRFGPAEPALIDERPYRASNAYRLRNVPTLYLVEPTGVISMAVSGFHKAALEGLAERFGTLAFGPGEQVPALRPG
jgi:thiol-disulfide isomerase/thioredoxin